MLPDDSLRGESGYDPVGGAATGTPSPDPRLVGGLEAPPWMPDAREQLDEVTLLRVWLEGRMMSRADAVDLALRVEGPAAAPTRAVV